MRSVLAAFLSQVAKFEARELKLSPHSLADPVQDADDRAAMVILMGAALESFLKDLVHAYLDAVCGRGTAFSDLPANLRKSHFEDGAKHLISALKEDVRKWTAAGGKDKIDFPEALRVAVRLGSVESAGYSLVWEGIGRTDSNASPETICAILKRLGVSEPWEAIAGNAKRRGVRGYSNLLRSELSALRDSRNRCAHGVPAATGAPQWSSLRGYNEALGEVAEAMVVTLESHLSALP